MIIDEQTFREGLQAAYRGLERVLNQTKEEVLGRIGGEPRSARELNNNFPQNISARDYIQNECVILPNNSLSRDGERVPLIIGRDYLAKVRDSIRGGRLGGLDDSFFAFRPEGFIEEKTEVAKCEETNVQILKELGFIRENGFYVPEHKVIGIKIVDGKAIVIEDSSGITITKDMSENGFYHVGEIEAYHFAILRNRKEFAVQYQRYMDKLHELYWKDSLNVTYEKHHREKDPAYSLAKMLLIRQREGIGEIFIGDLDNLVFEYKDGQRERK